MDDMGRTRYARDLPGISLSETKKKWRWYAIYYKDIYPVEG